MIRLRIPICFLFFLLISLPYLQAGLAPGPEFEFGGFFLNPMDGNTYLAKMRQGYDGAWQFRLPYTAEPGEGSYLFVFYLFLGHTARALGLSLLLMFHLARGLAAAVLLLALDRFFRALFPRPPASAAPNPFGTDSQPRSGAGGTALLAFALAALGSGMGWLAALAKWVPADLWVAEAYPFLASFSNPHFPLSLALMVWLLTPAAEKWQSAEGKGYSHRNHPSLLPFLNGHFYSGLRSAIGGLALSLLSPFGAVIAGLVLAGQTAWQWLEGWRGWRKETQNLTSFPVLRRAFWQSAAWVDPKILSSLLGLAAGSAPMLGYAFWIARVHPALAGWNAQNLTPTPPAWDILLSLSPALCFAAAEVWAGRREEPRCPHYRTLVLWAGTGLLLIFLPMSLQLRFMIGLFIPVAGLAAAGVERLARGDSLRKRRLSAVVFFLSLPGLLFIELAAAFSLQTHNSAVFLQRAEGEALRWIEHNTPPGALILAAADSGLFIPAHTGRRVIYGHPFETVNASVEKEAVENFYRPAPWNETERREFLEQRRVDYILFGPREQALGKPAILQELELVYQAGGVEIYAAR